MGWGWICPSWGRKPNGDLSSAARGRSKVFSLASPILGTSHAQETLLGSLLGVPELQVVPKPRHLQGLGQPAWPRLGTCFPWMVLVPFTQAAPRDTHSSRSGWHPGSTVGRSK